jgi:hypothetical protein
MTALPSGTHAMFLGVATEAARHRQTHQLPRLTSIDWNDRQPRHLRGCVGANRDGKSLSVGREPHVVVQAWGAEHFAIRSRRQVTFPQAAVRDVVDLPAVGRPLRPPLRVHFLYDLVD